MPGQGPLNAAPKPWPGAVRSMNFFQKISTKSWAPYVGLVAAGALIYSKSLFFGLTYLDDNYWTSDFHLNNKTPADCLKFFSHPDLISFSFYRPLLNIIFVVNAWIGHNTLWSYHAFNIGLHLINVCLVFACLRQFNYSREIAFWFALIFAVHPALTSAVAWIPGRTDSVLGFFILVSFIMYIEFLKTQSLGCFISHLIFWTAALLTKENAVVFPVVCAGYFFFLKREFNLSPKKIGLMTAAWLVLGAGWFLIRRHILNIEINAVYFQTLIQNLSAFVTYFGKTIFPVNLSVLPEIKDMPLGWGILAITLTGMLIIFSQSKRIFHMLAGGLWFLLFILPALTVDSALHEYRLYIPLLGVIMLLMETDIAKYLEPDERFPLKKQIARCVFGIIVVVFSLKTFYHLNVYRDGFVFWRQAVQTSPHASLAHSNLGSIYLLQNNLDKAKEEFQKALALNPRITMVHNNLGIVYMNEKNYDLALKEYQQEIHLNPTYANAYFNLGVLCYRIRRLDQAVYFWKKTLDYNDQHADAYMNLITYFYAQGDLNQATHYVREAQKRGIAPPAGFKN